MREQRKEFSLEQFTKDMLLEFEKKFPGNSIAQITIWNRKGTIRFKRHGTYREWKAAKQPSPSTPNRQVDEH